MSATNSHEEQGSQEAWETDWNHPYLDRDKLRFRPDGSSSETYRSIEYVLQSHDCIANRHLRRLTNGGCLVQRHHQQQQQQQDKANSIRSTASTSYEAWAERFIQLVVEDARLANIACQRSKGLKKELVEGVSMIEQVESMAMQIALANDNVCAQTGRGLLLLDLCSGKGIAAVLLALRFDQAQVVGLDIRPPSPTEYHLHDGFLPNFVRKTGNLYDDDLLDNIIRQETPSPGGTCILLGTHLCGDLSRCALDLVGRHDDDDDDGRIGAAVIVPCCLQRQKAPAGYTTFTGRAWGYDTTKVAREHSLDPFGLWLGRLQRRAPMSDENKILLYDPDMLSPKNVYLLLCKSGLGQWARQNVLHCQEVSTCSEQVAICPS